MSNKAKTDGQVVDLDAMRAKGAKTCPCSRHAHIIADMMANPQGPFREACAATGYDADHMASSIACVVQSLWDARRWLKWEGDAYTGSWVPDLESICPTTPRELSKGE